MCSVDSAVSLMGFWHPSLLLLSRGVSVWMRPKERLTHTGAPYRSKFFKTSGKEFCHFAEGLCLFQTGESQVNTPVILLRRGIFLSGHMNHHCLGIGSSVGSHRLRKIKFWSKKIEVGSEKQKSAFSQPGHSLPPVPPWG